MIIAVADTHALLWYLYDDHRLSQIAADLFSDAEKARNQIVLSSISLVEIVYLVEKRRIPQDSFELVIAALDTNELFHEQAVNRDVAQALRTINPSEVRDMPDRIIAATAVKLQVPLISKDRHIQASRIQTIW